MEEEGGDPERAAGGRSATFRPAADTLMTAGSKADAPGELARYRAVVWSRPPRGALGALRTQGFSHVRSYRVVPSLQSTRWYLPTTTRRAARRACDLYSPTTILGRMARGGARLMTGLGASCLLGEHLLLGSRAPSDIDAALSDAVSGRPFRLAVSLPHETGQWHRLWLLAIDDRGVPLAFAKYAYRPESAASLRREVEATRRMQASEWRSFTVPALLAATEIADGYLMVSAPLESDARESPGQLGARHFNVLVELAARPSARSTDELTERLAARCEALRSSLPASWADRLARAVDLVRKCSGLRELPTVRSHGDFVPWNIRVRPGDSRLVVFDWEQSEESQFALWDGFNFLAQVHIVLQRVSGEKSVARALACLGSSPLARALRLEQRQVACLHLAYLADASARWFESHRPFSTWSLEMSRTRTQPVRAGMIDAALALAERASRG
jgi:hypothetical protein